MVVHTVSFIRQIKNKVFSAIQGINLHIFDAQNRKRMKQVSSVFIGRTTTTTRYHSIPGCIQVCYGNMVIAQITIAVFVCWLSLTKDL